jgi:hypothetical protein
VNVWVYEGTLKLEHQAVTLSKYRVEVHEDRRHIKDVSNPRVAETVFRSKKSTIASINCFCLKRKNKWPPGKVRICESLIPLCIASAR